MTAGDPQLLEMYTLSLKKRDLKGVVLLAPSFTAKAVVSQNVAAYAEVSNSAFEVCTICTSKS